MRVRSREPAVRGDAEPARRDHDHGGGAHSHVPRADADARYLAAALAMIVGFMLVEVVVGIVAHSLALITDAGHMLTDAASIGLALVAVRLATRPAHGAYTFGLKRTEIVSAQVNGITLVVLVVVFVYEAVRRLLDPVSVAGWPVLITALVGMVVNIAAAWSIGRADRRSLNVRGALAHIVTDLYAFIATAVAGLVVVLTGFARADAAAALLVAALMARAGVSLLRESGRVFLEAAPRGIDPAAIDADLHRADGVVDVHDLHVWEVTSGFPALSAHLLVAPDRDCHERRIAVETLLHEKYGVAHTTLQVDHRAPAGTLPMPHLRDPDQD